MNSYNIVSKEEAEDLRFLLDDADLLHSVPHDGATDRMLQLWRRLHLWLLSEQGDRDAQLLLRQEFPRHREKERGSDTVVSDLALTDEVINHIVMQYNLKYEELSEDPFEDAEGGMSVPEKHQRACSAARRTIRHYLRTNQFRHYSDVELYERSLSQPVPAEATS